MFISAQTPKVSSSPPMRDASSSSPRGMTLDRWLRDKGVTGVGLTGHVVSAGRVPLLQTIMALRSAAETCVVVQTGFNAGHSANAILSFRPASKLVSFQKLASQGGRCFIQSYASPSPLLSAPC